MASLEPRGWEQGRLFELVFHKQKDFHSFDKVFTYITYPEQQPHSTTVPPFLLLWYAHAVQTLSH